MNSKMSYAGAIFWMATLVASNTVTAHIVASNSGKSGNSAVAAEKVKAFSVSDGPREASAPYRDGVFMAKLSQQRGEFAKPSVGRWATQGDRAAFAAGFDHAYQVVEVH